MRISRGNCYVKWIIGKQHLNVLDAEERSKNLITTGIYEHDIIEEENIYGDDSNIAAIFSKIGVVIPQGFTVTRIGKQKDNYSY